MCQRLIVIICVRWGHECERIEGMEGGGGVVGSEGKRDMGREGEA